MQTKFNSTQQQEGMTFIGIVIMFLFIGVLILAVLKVFPLYYQDNGLKKALDGFVAEFKENPSMSKIEMEKSLQRRFDGQDVVRLTAKDIKIKGTRKGYELDASYEAVENFIGNLNFMVDFTHVIELEK